MILAAKNCVVTISPAAPYQSGRLYSAGIALNAPRGCLSNPTARPRSYSPDRIAICAENSADPPAAQPLRTLMNCAPVRPSCSTIESGLPAASDAP